MPTTEPPDELNGDDGGQLKPIAGFGTTAAVTAAAPTAVPAPSAPQTPPRTTPASPASTPAATTHRHTSLRTPPGLSLNRRPAAAETTSHTATQPLAHRDNAYTDADVTNAWSQFIAQNSARHLLVNAMQAAMPVRSTGHTFTVAQSQVQIDLIRENMAAIRAFVRDRAGNDNIDFDLQLVSEDSPLVWNDHELVQHMVEQNPEIAVFIDRLKLSIL